MTKQFVLAFSTFVGTIIGVGVFGLPYVAMKFGFWPTVLIHFPLLVLLTLLIHWVFAEICLRTPGIHRQPGYAKIYLGRRGELVALLVTLVSLFGAMLAYLIIGAEFVTILLMPLFGGSYLIYILIYFTLAAMLISTDSRSIGRAEFISLIVLILALAYIFIRGLPQIDASYFAAVNWSNFFLPYGVILFSLSGISVIPDVVDLVERRPKAIKNVINAGILSCAVIYILFIILVLGISGPLTSADAISGIQSLLGPTAFTAALIFGIMAAFTSYLTAGQVIKKMLHFDLKFDGVSAWIFAAFVPLLLYFIGLQDFISVVSFTGAVGLGVWGIMIFMMYRRLEKTGPAIAGFKFRLPNWLADILMVLFVTGVILELICVF